MKLKLDENLPDALRRELVGLGHDVDTVKDEQIVGEPDAMIWREAQRTKRFLITQDLDFSDIRQFAPGQHEGLMLVRLRAPGRLALTQRLRQVFGSEDVESWSRCFVLVTDIKVRVHRPT